MNHPIYIPLPTPFAIGPANAYLFPGTGPDGAELGDAGLKDSGPTLVDCGVDTDDSWDALTTALAQNGLTVTDLQRVIITHAHVDHMGMAARIAANSDAQIVVWEEIAPWAYATEIMWQTRIEFMGATLHQIDMADLQRDSILEGMSHALSFWPTVPKARVTTFALSDKLQIGGQPWEVVYAPGHSNTQTCFFQPETGQFIAADMLLPLTPAPVLEHMLDDTTKRDISLPRLLQSYELVHKMPISHVYPGHGEPFKDHRSLIERQQERITMRKAECLALLQAGNHQVGQMLDIMYGHHPETARFTAVCTLIGYLDLLLEDGSVCEVIEDGMKRYCVS